jgi:PAS domain S-box-containing protein
MKEPMDRSLILNVDDNSGARYVKTRILARAGFDVLEASNGQAALDKVRECAPDLVLLDVKLPDINGLEVCRQIKRDPRTAATLVLQTSAAAIHTTDKVRALDGGADGYLIEPIDASELVANIKALLRLRHLERTLRESEERFRQLAENIDDVFWMLDPRTDVLLYISPAYSTLLGHELSPFPRASSHWSHQHIHPDDVERVETAYELLRREGRYEQEYRILRSDESVRWVRERAFPVRDPAGQTYRLAGVTSDITTRKLYELEMLNADRRKDQFLAMLAHELRNPLAPIRQAVEIMDPDKAFSPRVLDDARMIVSRQVTHLTRLVDDLLDVSRATQGKIKLKVEQVDLEAAISAAIETAKPVIDKKQHRLVAALPSSPVTLQGDSIRVAQVIGNVLSNAAKYTPKGGVIDLWTTSNDGFVCVHVRDNGIGIAAEMLTQVFDLFVQSESSLERSEGGLGIGLSLARTLMELHGGSIVAQSRGLGQGSEFIATWPCRTERLPTTQALPESKRPLLAPVRRRILLVEDSPDAALALSYLLESLGHEISLARDGHLALEVAEKLVPDIVILDIGLPGMDGYEVARRMRELPDLRSTVLIALTGYGQEDDRRRSREAGFDHHFVKPVSFEEIERVLGGLAEN